MRRLVGPAVALVARILTASPVAAASWGHPIAMTQTHDAFPTYARGLAVAGGVVHLADSRTGGQLEYRRSTTGGATWSAPMILAQPDAQFTSVPADPAIAARGSLVVFAYRAHDATAAYLFIRRSLDRGLTWGAPQQIVQEVTDRRVGEDSVAISSSGVFVVWTDRLSGAIDLRRSVDGGATFSAPQAIGTTTFTFFPGNPAFTDGLIGLAASGRYVDLAWSPSGDGTADSIVLSRSVDGGATFLPPTTILGIPNFGWASLRAAGSYLVGEVTAADGSLWVFRSADGGRHVTSRRIASPGTTTFVSEGSVAADADGNLLVSYSRSGSPVGTAAAVGTVLVRRSHDGGRHWSDPQSAVRHVSGIGNISTTWLDEDRSLLVYGTCQDASFEVCDLAAVRGH